MKAEREAVGEHETVALRDHFDRDTLAKDRVGR